MIIMPPLLPLPDGQDSSRGYTPKCRNCGEPWPLSPANASWLSKFFEWMISEHPVLFALGLLCLIFWTMATGFMWTMPPSQDPQPTLVQVFATQWAALRDLAGRIW